ncbi:hypothetical protein HOF26_01235 [bacterium]|mgnify:FL=1|nr:hypothetical protein [bacterium]MBT6131296.1 hypothetical protein [bacterium]
MKKIYSLLLMASLVFVGGVTPTFCAEKNDALKVAAIAGASTRVAVVVGLLQYSRTPWYVDVGVGVTKLGLKFVPSSYFKLSAYVKEFMSNLFPDL